MSNSQETKEDYKPQAVFPLPWIFSAAAKS